MTEVTKGFSPSVNIERDLWKDLNYVVTPNAKQIYNSIVTKRRTGTHAFTIIGSYGTGKSSFLVALRKNLMGETPIFHPIDEEFSGVSGFEFDYLVGSYESIIEQLKTYFGLKKTATVNDLLKKIDDKHSKLKAEGKFWFFVIDEFGKNLEFSAKENPEKDLYFIQQFAEYVNDTDKNVFLITTLHQAFDSYAFGLDIQQRKEWDKVRGRLKELTFNEPVEQLLFIVSEYLKNNKKNPPEKVIQRLLELIETSKAFPLRSEVNTELLKSLFPLEPLAAATLSLALQKYGQNERSLFTFLETDELHGLNNYDNNSNAFYNLKCVYDYLIYNYHSFLSSKYNPDYIQWNALKKALERIEVSLDEHIDEAKSIVKTIGLLNLFSNSGARIDHKFLDAYSTDILNIKNSSLIIALLDKKQVIRYRDYKQQYVLFEGTDFDIDHELQQASSKVQLSSSIVEELKKYFTFPYIPAKRAYFEKGTPRYFEFLLSEKPYYKQPKHPIDGYINLVFGRSKFIVNTSSNKEDLPILYAFFNNHNDIKKQLFLIERTKYLISKIDGDQVALRELNELLESQADQLNNLIIGGLYSSNENISWIYQGKQVSIFDSKSMNFQLSEICDDVYSKTPMFDNELVNRERVSPSVYKPRKSLLERLIHKSDQPDLGFEENEFPAEKTIYLSLLKNSGIHRIRNGLWSLGEPFEDSGLIELWNESENFFNSTKSGKKPVKDLFNALKNPPYGLKSGFIELWVPIYLIIKGDDYALYQEEAYIPELTFDVINLVYRNPKLFEVKAYHISDVKRSIFAQYRSMNNADTAVSFTNKSFIETIRPFLLLYNNLNEYGRYTSKISPEAQRLRDAIKTATEPEKAFFEDFVAALNFNLNDLVSDNSLGDFIQQLNSSIEEIKNSYAELINNVEKCIRSALNVEEGYSFQDLQKLMKTRYQSIENYDLSPYQRKLLGSLRSELSDREKWISSISYSILEKPLTKLKDSEEPLLMRSIPERLEELDNLVALDKLEFNPKQEEAFMIRLQSFQMDSQKINIVVDKEKLKEQSSKVSEIKSLLTSDKKLNQAILIKIIEELDSHE